MKTYRASAIPDVSSSIPLECLSEILKAQVSSL